MTKSNTIQTKKHNKKKIFLVILIIFSIAFFSAFCWISSIASKVKLNDELLSSFNSPIVLYDNKGEKISESVNGEPYTQLNALNPYTISSFIDIEDKNFYSHKGINFPRIVKAFFTNFFAGGIEQGASTISQQLIKNTHLTNEKTYTRKIKEIALTLQMEKKYTKEQILEMYLNAIYFGNGCYGIESASNFYFSKKASELSINESAILAGIIKSPATYCPITNKEKITERKNLILKKMLENKDISSSDYNKNVTEPVSLNINYSSSFNNQAYYSASISEASEILNVSPLNIANSGYKIITYFDNNASKMLELNSSTETNALHNSIIVDNSTYGVIAFSASLPYGAIETRRSPASTIKPILVYSPAIEKGIIQPSSIILDEKTTFDNGYSPLNIGDKYYGNISVTEALAKSLNVPAVKLLKEVGIENAKNYAKQLNLHFEEQDKGLSLALGSMYKGITIKELVNAYSPFVFNGNYNELSFIKEIQDKNGNIIYSRSLQNKNVMSEQTSYLVGTMLKQTTKTGTCQALKNFDFDILAKSGTNGTENPNKNTDSICIAQTTNHTACMWFFSKDYTDKNLLENASTSGLSPTIRIKNIFEELYKSNKPFNFKKPINIEAKYLDLIDYQKGIITLAQEKTPNEYKFLAEFCNRFTPKTLSKNFSHLIIPIISSTQLDNIVSISFMAEPSQDYELIIEEYDSNMQLLNYNVEPINNLIENTIKKDIQVSQEKTYKIYVNTNFKKDSTTKQSNIVWINNSQSFWLNY